MAWSAQNHQFLFYHLPPSEDFEYTKRNVLKKTAALFDLLGFLAPFVVKAKLFVQQAWVEALQWDDPLPSKQEEEWRNWFSDLSLQEIKIPQCLKDSSSQVNFTSLHTFTDASEKAYCRAVYSRHEYKGGEVTTRLIPSKT